MGQRREEWTYGKKGRRGKRRVGYFSHADLLKYLHAKIGLFFYTGLLTHPHIKFDFCKRSSDRPWGSDFYIWDSYDPSII